MAQTQKFLFDDTFDGDVAEQLGPGKKEKAPTFTEAELAEAEQRSLEAGRAAALQEAKDSAEERIAVSLDALIAQFADLREQAERSQEQQQQDTLSFACQALGKLFPALAEQGALQEAERVLETCLARLRAEPRIVLRTGDALHDLLRDRVDQAASQAGFEGRIVLITEETMGPSDIRVEWADGGAERDTTALWTEIEAIVSRSSASPATSLETEADGEPVEATETPVPEESEAGQVGATA